MNVSEKDFGAYFTHFSGKISDCNLSKQFPSEIFLLLNRKHTSVSVIPVRLILEMNQGVPGVKNEKTHGTVFRGLRIKKIENVCISIMLTLLLLLLLFICLCCSLDHQSISDIDALTTTTHQGGHF